ncbi:hypothetical protein ACLX1H_005755 [Fusarium chlamydosporum]
MPQQFDAEEVARIATVTYLRTALGREPTEEEIQEILGPARDVINGGNNRRTRCWNCGRRGHTRGNCPERDYGRPGPRGMYRQQRSQADPPYPPPPYPPPPYDAANEAAIRAPAPRGIDNTVPVLLPVDEPQSVPPLAPEPRTGRPPARLGWSVHWSRVWARWYYRKFLDGTVSWEEPRENRGE